MSKKEYDCFIYTHIPKCGGTSFRKFINDSALKSEINEREIYIPGFNGLENNKNIPELNAEELRELQKRHLKVIANHAKFNVHEEFNLGVRNPFYFTILRDPIKRFISHYNFFYYKLGYDNCKGKSLDDLEPEKRDRIVHHLANVQVKYLSNIKHIRIVGLDNMLRLAKSNLLLEYNCFGTIENMDETLDKLRWTKPDWLNIKSNFPKLNKSNSHKVKLSDEVLELISQANNWDLSLYQFAQKHFYKQTILSES